MKSMLYVGAALMIGASIYGFVDYRENSGKKEFKDLYHHKEVKEPVISEEKKAIVTEEKEVIRASAAKTELKTVPAVTEEKKAAKKPVVKKKKKKINYRDFSRGSLREEREVIKVEPEKKDVKTVEDKQKEQ